MSRIAPEVWARLAGGRPAGDALTARLAAPAITERLLAALLGTGTAHTALA